MAIKITQLKDTEISAVVIYGSRKVLRNANKVK